MTNPKERLVPGDREFELKFSIDPAACEALVSHPALMTALRDRRLSHLSSTYFDTPDERLRGARLTLRVRKSEGGSVQTLKQAAHSIVDRAEWEHPVAGPWPDMTPFLAPLRETPLKALLEAVDGALAPRFTVDVTRATFPLRHGTAEIEAALDRGAIRADGLALEVSELELESKRGRLSAVFDVARDLVADLPLTLSLASKSERGYAMAHLEWGRPTKDIALTLAPGMCKREAFEAIVQACLHALTRNAALVIGEADGEAVHRSRIALRRLRAAFDLFAPILRRKRSAKLRGEMRWIARQLGDARDADVLQQAVLEPATRDPLLSGAPALAHLMRESRGASHARLREALASPRWRLLLVELLAFSIDGVRRSRRRGGYRGFVRRRLAARRGDLAGRVRGLGKCSPRALHDIRKDAKQLRYDLELFDEVEGLGAGRPAYARLRDGLETLQERLGLLQDEAAMRVSLGAVLDGERPAHVAPETWRSATSAARALMAPRPAADAAMRKAAKAARKIRAAKPF